MRELGLGAVTLLLKEFGRISTGEITTRDLHAPWLALHWLKVDILPRPLTHDRSAASAVPKA